MPYLSIQRLAPALALAALLALPATLLHAAPSAAAASFIQLAPIDKAHTFAQAVQGGRTSTLFVLAASTADITAIDLSELSGLHSGDAFDVIGHFDTKALDQLAARSPRTQRYRLEDLAGIGPRGRDHIAAGTNYAAHGEEVGVDEAFLFPKRSPASGPRSALTAAPGTLMDYEVELCARFDRELRSLADFDAARKGFFLCGDFTDRATLVRNIDLKNIPSGDGFADAKSGHDRFPVGPFLVVPRDWRAFLKDVHIETWVDGKRRQRANAGTMFKDLRTIVQETLAEAGTRTWSYQDRRIPMVERAAIGTASAILTGTGDGVVFNTPDAATMQAVMTARDRRAQLAVIDTFIAGEAARGIYLQPGNDVIHAGTYLGSIHTTVVPASGR